MAATPNEALVGNFASSTPSTLMGFAQTTGLPGNIILGSNLSMTGTTLNATGGGGGGSVTSVALSGGTTGITVSGSPITTSGTITLSGVLVAVNGGTGQSVYAIGDILQASSTTALAKLAAVATGNVLLSGGVGVVSSWGKVGLTTHISGTLPVANGGTNITSYTTGDIIYASSSSVLAKLPVGTNGQVLTLSGGLPTWQTGGGGGSGTVTSVSMTVPSIFNISGSPITTSGTLGVTLANETANTIFAGPASGAAAAPTFRASVLADLPFNVIEDVTGTTYSFSAADNKKIKRFTNVSGCTATVPTGLTTGWETIAYRGSGAGTLTLASAGTLEAAGSTLNTEKTSAFILHRGSNIHVALGAFSTGITNTAANNELAKSDGTNLIPSGFFSSVSGTLTVASGSLTIDANTAATIIKGNNVAFTQGTGSTNGGPYISIARRTANPPLTSGANVVIYAENSSDATTALSLYTEQVVEAIGTFTASHKYKIQINGVFYWINLDLV